MIREKKGFIWYEEQMVLLMVNHGRKDLVYPFLNIAEERYDLFLDKIYEFLKLDEKSLLIDETGRLYYLDELGREEHLYYPVLNIDETIDGPDIIDDVFLVLSHIEEINRRLVSDNTAER